MTDQVQEVRVAEGVSFGGSRLAVIAGPCVIESLDMCRRVAEQALGICSGLGIGYVFKASFDKANRTSVDSYRGPGLDEGLEILAEEAGACSKP